MAKKKQQTVYSFGSSLRRAREKREYTREQIAERAGISPRFVSAIENDRRKPSLDVLIRLVHAIGASFDEVLAPRSRFQRIIQPIGSNVLLHSAANEIKNLFWLLLTKC